MKFITAPLVALVRAIAIQGEFSAARAALVRYYPFNGDAKDASGPPLDPSNASTELNIDITGTDDF